MQEADAFENLRGWNNNRKKAYLLYDFVFYRYYLSHPEVVEKLKIGRASCRERV